MISGSFFLTLAAIGVLPMIPGHTALMRIHVFAYQKGPMGLLIRSIGMARARVKIGLANLAYNMRRYVWLSRRIAVV